MENPSPQQPKDRTIFQVISAFTGRDYGRKAQHVRGGTAASSPRDGNQSSVRAAGGAALSLKGNSKVENQHSAPATHVARVVSLSQLGRFTDSGALKRRAHSHGFPLQPQGSRHTGNWQRLSFKPFDITRQLTRAYTLRKPVADPHRSPGEKNHDAVQDARRSAYKLNIRPLASGTIYSQTSKSATRSSVSYAHSLFVSSFSPSPRASLENSGPSSRSASPPRDGGTPLQSISYGSIRPWLYPADTSRPKGFLRAKTARHARSERRPSEGARRSSAFPSWSSGWSVRPRQGASPQGGSSTGSQPPLPDSLEKLWHGVLSNASPALTQLAKDLLGEYVFLNKSSFPELDARDTRLPCPDTAGGANRSEMQDRKNDDENSAAGTYRSSQGVVQVASERVYMLDGVVLPDAARRFLLANLLFLGHNHEYFSLWAELHTAHQQLTHLSSSVRHADTTEAKAIAFSPEQSVHSLLPMNLEGEQPASKTDQLPTAKFYEKDEVEDSSGPDRSQGSRAACPLPVPNKIETLSGTHPLEHQITEDAGARDMMPPEEHWERHSGTGSRSSSESLEDNVDSSATGLCRAVSFHQGILHISHDEEEESLETMRLSRRATEIQVQSAPSKASESSPRSSLMHERSESTQFNTGGSTGERTRGDETGSCTLDGTTGAKKADQDKAEQFDAVVARLKSAATKSRASIQALRSEVINAQAITNGHLLSIIFRLFDSTGPTPSTMVLPLVAGAYVFILASLLEARKRCCQLLVACCNALCGVLEHQLYKGQRLQRDLLLWATASADLTRQMETLNSSTLKLTSAFVVGAKQAFIDILAIAYPFASLLHAHRLRKRQVRERARQRRLKMRKALLGSLAVKCQNELADLQLREGVYRQRLSAALKIQQDAAARAEDLSVSILNLRKEELKLQSSRPATSRDPRRLLGLEAKLAQVAKQRQQQQEERATLEGKSQHARDLMAAIQEEQRRSTETKRQLQQQQTALRNERKNLQRVLVQSNEHSLHQHADHLGDTDNTSGLYGAAKLCEAVFPDARSDAEGQLRCIAELTQLVVWALKLHVNDIMIFQTGSARDADIALLSKAYRQYLLRAGKENDFRHTLLSCTPLGSAENGIDNIAKSESEASFCDDDRSLSLRSAGGSLFGCADPSVHLENGYTPDTGRTESTRYRPGERRGTSGGSPLGSVCELQRVRSFASFSSPRTPGSGAAAACSLSKYNSARCDEAPNLESNGLSQLLEEPMLVARLTGMQVMGVAKIAPLSHISGAAWELMDDMLLAYDELKTAD